MIKYNYPLLFKPIPVPKIWAGDKLVRIPGRQTPETNENTGESWDISTWPTAPDNSKLETVTRITNGPLAGTKLDEVASVPVVVKLIDSAQKLSIQNHPNKPDAHKNEMWYIIEADEDAYLYFDLAEGITPEKFCELLNETPASEEKILNALNCYRPVKPGSYFYVPAPTVHALGPGLLTFEISERSQTTYRLFDYNRARSLGKLDIKEGCEALMAPQRKLPDLKAELQIENADSIEEITAFPTFRVMKVTGQKMTIQSSTHQHLITACTGDCQIQGPTPDWNIRLGYTFTCLVPPVDKPYSLDLGENGTVLINPLQESS